jgi:hypothetical protein
MNLKTVTIANLKPHPQNPNTHPAKQISALGDSLDEFDQVKNVVIWNRTILAGHGVIEAAIKSGRLTLDAVDVSHWPEDKATAFMLADIRTPGMAIVDEGALVEALRAIDAPLDIPGFDEDFLAGFDFNAEKYQDFDKQLKEIEDFQDVNITIVIPLKYVDQVKEWLANGEQITAPGMGKGVLKRCGLL